MKNLGKAISDFLKQSRSTGIVEYIVKGSLIVYTFLLFGIPLILGKIPIPTPEQILFLVLTYAVFVGKGAGFLRDLAPLVILFFAYEAMRGVVIAGEQNVITDYWSSGQSMNGFEVNVTPRMLNVGDAAEIKLMTNDSSIRQASILITKVGGGPLTTEISGVGLSDGKGSYLIKEAYSAKVFSEVGVYNITAYSPDRKEVNGSSAVAITRNVHYKEPVELERKLFGGIPSVYLQQQFYREGQVSLLDIIAIITYIVHIPLPFFFASYIWFKDRELYKKYSAAFLLLAYAGLVTFLLYPAAPPWLASLVGYADGVKKVYYEISKTLSLMVLPSLYYWINANEVAAMPSLHAAFPLLISIFSVKLWGKKGWLVFLYPIATAFSLVYLGEHYAVDVLLGFVYVLAVLAFVELIFKREESKRRRG